MIGANLQSKLTGKLSAAGKLAMSLWILCLLMCLCACGTDTVRFKTAEIPESLLRGGSPGVIEDPSSASRADFASAYLDSYVAWEGCAANLDRINSILSELSAVQKR